MTPGDDDKPDEDVEVAESSASPGEEPSEGSIAASEELEAALREATESVEAREAEGEPTGALSEEVQAAQGEFEELSQERDELLDRCLRLQAEFENFRRRTLKERQEGHNYGHQNLVKDLLPTVDNLDRALGHSAESAEGSGGEDLQALLQGIEMVRQEFLGVLGKHGMT